MRKLEATTERVQVPPMMTRDWHIDVRVKTGRKSYEWKTVYTEKDNWNRLRKVSFEPQSAVYGIRLVVDKTWGAEKAHVFAFDVL